MSITSLLLGAKATLVEPALAEGEVAPITLNADGRIRVATKPGLFPNSAAALTGVNNALSIDVTDASNIVAHVKNTGTVSMTAGVFAFEGSVDSTDGINGTWFAIQAVRTNANAPELVTPTLSLTAAAGSAYAWEASVNGLRFFRVRCTTAVTASSIATWTVLRGSYATEPIPATQTHAVTGSGSFAITPTAGTPYLLTSLATTNAVLISNAARTLTELSVFNPTAATIYVKFFNKATAPVPGTDVPTYVVPVLAGAAETVSFGILGKRFSVGLGITIVAGAVSTDSVAVGAGALVHATYI